MIFVVLTRTRYVAEYFAKQGGGVRLDMPFPSRIFTTEFNILVRVIIILYFPQTWTWTLFRWRSVTKKNTAVHVANRKSIKKTWDCKE